MDNSQETAASANWGTRFNLTLERSFAAPRDLVFAAWTDPAQLAAWWGPRGFTNPVCRFDARVGGEIHIDMQGPDGTIYPMGGRVVEIEPPSRLVFTSYPLDRDGNPVFEVETIVELAEDGAGTALTLGARIVWANEGAEAYLKGMEQGWGETLDRLAAHVESRTA